MKKHKLSYYTIFTEPIDDQTNILIFSSRSGKTMKVHRYLANLLLDGLCEVIPERQKDILIKNMFLVPAEENELDTVISENKDNVFNNKKTLYEVIEPSANCQLGCYYCGQDHKKSNLSDDIATKIVDRIVYKFESGGFEGEPLMSYQRCVKSTSNYENVYQTWDLS